MILTKSNQVVKSKPKSGAIKTSVVNQTTINSIDDLVEVVLSNPFNSANASGIKEKDWISQQIFTLDFDGGITPQEIGKRCTHLSLIPNIMYSTFSDTLEKRKFRVLFILDKEITDYKVAKYLQRGLMKLFPESDQACKDLCRMYYPGKDILYRTDELNESDWIINFTHGLVAENYRFYQNVSYKENKETVLPDMITDYSWTQACEEIDILDKFLNQNYRMSYDILFGLATNLQYISGGMKLLIQRMIEINKMGGGTYFPDISRGIEKYPDSYFVSLKNVRKYNYLPKPLEKFSKCQKDYAYHNLLEVKFKRGRVDILKQQKLISLDDAVDLMNNCYDLAKRDIPFTIEYSDIDPTTGESKPYIKEYDPLVDTYTLPEHPIYIFKITTGAGKSEAFLKENNTLIALPFHRLKDEMSDRMLVDHRVTPETPLFSDDEINDIINQYRESTLYSDVSSIIQSISKGKLILNGKNINLTKEDIEKAQLVIEMNRECKKDNRTLLTTHTRAINEARSVLDFGGFTHDLVIFDEDPLGNIVDIDTFDLDFRKFYGCGCSKKILKFIKTLETYFNGLLEGAIINLPKIVKPVGFNKICASIGMSKLIKLLSAELIYKEIDNKKPVIRFCITKEFLKNKKIFIMSATAPIPIYKALFGDRVIVIDITNIKPMGVIEQYTSRGFSSSSMSTENYNKDVYVDLFSKIAGTKVITHLKRRDLFKGSYQLTSDGSKPHNFYYGNCSGGDSLNGCDISVVGTPHKPEYVYLFYAKLINLPNSADDTLRNRIIEWNDLRFRFFTYENPTLRDIQLSLIESEILQAAGRSRYLRNPNITKIFSNLPVKIATKYIQN